MIEINLLPHADRGSTRGPAFRFALAPSGSGSSGPAKRWVLLTGLAWIIAIAILTWMVQSTRHARSDIDVAFAGARLDSTRHARIRAANAILAARRDTIAQKLEIIQQVDAGRYTWAHILDEVGEAVPQHTWLVRVGFVSSASALGAPKFIIEGRSGNTFSLTQFMQDLEASPFLHNVKLIQTDQIREADKLLYSFGLECEFEEPPAEVIETVPLFASQGDGVLSRVAADSVEDRR